MDTAIVENGEAGKVSLIRSSKHIMNIHEAVKSMLIERGFDKNHIFPPLDETKPELKLSGFIKSKNQDICVKPKQIQRKQEILTEGVLSGIIDEYGYDYTEQILSINVRSQISSLGKNFDTLYERTILEAFNLHMRCRKMCLGEVYLLAIPEYDSESVKTNEICFVGPSSKLVQGYIRAFQKINERNNYEIDDYKYESVCLLIVDFSGDTPILFKNNAELIARKLISSDFDIEIANLGWEIFFDRLINEYNKRFPVKNDFL